jgi:hypothetical protein
LSNVELSPYANMAREDTGASGLAQGAVNWLGLHWLEREKVELEGTLIMVLGTKIKSTVGA